MGDGEVTRRQMVACLSAGAAISAVPLAASAQDRSTPLQWSSEDRLRYSRFTTGFAASFPTPIDCAGLAVRALATFAGANKLPLRLFDYDPPSGPFDHAAGSKRWIVFDPRVDDWKRFRDYVAQQFGAINVIENTIRISPDQAIAGDLLMTENRVNPQDYTGHTRLLVSMRYDAAKRDYLTVRYEGNLPPVVPVRVEGWLGEVDNLYQDAPRRWNFDQFTLR